MFGPAIALAIGAKFVPLRKPRKLPVSVKATRTEVKFFAANEEVILRKQNGRW